jgi:hypothetical protein
MDFKIKVTFVVLENRMARVPHSLAVSWTPWRYWVTRVPVGNFFIQVFQIIISKESISVRSEVFQQVKGLYFVVAASLSANHSVTDWSINDRLRGQGWGIGVRDTVGLAAAPALADGEGDTVHFLLLQSLTSIVLGSLVPKSSKIMNVTGCKG